MLSKRLLSALRAIRRQFSSAAHGAEQELLAGGFIRPRPDGHGFELTGAGIRALSPSSSGACKTNASGSAAVRHIKHEESAVGDMEASRSARIRQATKVNKFQDRQRRRHRWVSFIDLVALFTRSGKTREEIERMEAAAYEKLCGSIRRGEFDRAGRSMVLHLSERPGLSPRMTRERLQAAGEICRGPRAWEMFCEGWLKPCWIPVGMAVAWCRAHDVEPLPAWLKSTDSEMPPRPTKIVTARKKRGPKPGTLRRFVGSDRALFPALEQIMIRDHKSRSAAAQSLAEAGKVAGMGIAKSRAARLAAIHERERVFVDGHFCDRRT